MSKATRRAYVFGSNGPVTAELTPLRYAVRDADQIAGVLAAPRCGFKVRRPVPGATVAAVLTELEEVAENCGPDDEFICYFSGHGVLEGGSLLLLWDETDLVRRPLATGIPISRLMTALSFCKARNKLLILDCCHAGAAASALGLKSGARLPIKDIGIVAANHLMLVAGDRLDRTREFDSLGGGFLTTSICLALSGTASPAGDSALISIDDLHHWLQERTKTHNRISRDRVPTPYLVGQRRGEFLLTQPVPWPAWTIELADGTRMPVLPMSRRDGTAVAMAPRPVVNAEYRQFVAATGHPPPEGKQLVGDRWTAPFRPWDDERFRGDVQPVVCVNAADARSYCSWRVGGRAWLTDAGGHRLGQANIICFDLPTVAEWELAAFGHLPKWNERHVNWGWDWNDPRDWLPQYHPADMPTNVGAEPNPWGFTDLIGNVWEWCLSSRWIRVNLHALLDSAAGIARFSRLNAICMPRIPSIRMDWSKTPGDIDDDFELRGGGFLDDLTRTRPREKAVDLADGARTRHNDLGMRTVLQFKVDADLFQHMCEQYPGKYLVPTRAKAARI
jgi:formylglycine-generating enzyme required for sulfatase activity